MKAAFTDVFCKVYSTQGSAMLCIVGQRKSYTKTTFDHETWINTRYTLHSVNIRGSVYCPGMFGACAHKSMIFIKVHLTKGLEFNLKWFVGKSRPDWRERLQNSALVPKVVPLFRAF